MNTFGEKKLNKLAYRAPFLFLTRDMVKMGYYEMLQIRLKIITLIQITTQWRIFRVFSVGRTVSALKMMPRIKGIFWGMEFGLGLGGSHSESMCVCGRFRVLAVVEMLAKSGQVEKEKSCKVG